MQPVILYAGDVAGSLNERGQQVTTPSRPFVSNFHARIGQITLQVDVVSGAPTWTVQHTLDPILTSVAALGAAQWHNHATASNQTGAGDCSYGTPVMGVRVLATGGVVRVKVVQTD